MRRIARAVLDRAGGGPFQKVLDAGCGTGGTLDWAEKDLGACELWGVDISADAVAHCRRRSQSWQLSQASVLQLPFSDSSFDLVICFDVLQHLSTDGSDACALREFARVLAPGGTLVIRTNSRSGMGNAGKRKDRDFQRYSLDQLHELLKSTDLSVAHISCANAIGAMFNSIKEAVVSRFRSPEDRSQHCAYEGLRVREPPPLLNAAYLKILCGEAWYLRRGLTRIPFGHSLIAVLRKPLPSTGNERKW